MPQFRVNYGDAVIRDGFFLRRHAPTQHTSYADGSGSFFQHLSTFPGRSTIKEAVLNLLAQAQQHVFFCNFLLQDEEIVGALLNAARRLNGHVYILTTLKQDDFNRGGTAADDEEDFKSHMCQVKKLTQQGALVKARSDCHAKFMTVDDVRAIITSANAVPTCYGNVSRANGDTRKANPENGVLFTVPGEVRRLANFFRALWRNACNYYIAPNASVFEVKQIQCGTPGVRPTEPSQPADECEVLWTAPDDKRLLTRFRDMIRKAQREVSLSTWVVKDMDRHELGDDIREAATRGVRFQILVRGMNRRDDHRRQCYLLARDLGKNAVILGDYYNHSKAIVVDSDEAMVLTANLDAQHGLDDGVEVGFHSSQGSFVSAVNAFLARLASDAAFEFVADPKQADMAERSGRQRAPQLNGGVRIQFQTAAEQVRRLVEEWCDAARRELVRVATLKGEHHENVVLLTDHMAIDAHRRDADTLVAQQIRNGSLDDDPKRFDYSYLAKGTIICDIPTG